MYLRTEYDGRKIRDFTLSDQFISEFVGKQPKWGPVGYLTFKRTYARPTCSCEDPNICEHPSEEFWQCCQRVVEGVYTIQKQHCKTFQLPWSDRKAQKSSQEMFQRMWDFKFLPSGRGLSMMGTEVVYLVGSAALCACAFTSTENIDIDFSAPFCFLMDMSMLGAGVGSDPCRGTGKVKIFQPRLDNEPHVVEDSREGWVELIRRILDSYVGKGTYPTNIDYSQIRPRGAPIKTLGGVAPGPGPLIDLVTNLTNLLGNLPDGTEIKPSHIVDIFNYIGKCVVSGGRRRTSEIMLGDPYDSEFLSLKQDKEARDDRRWASNNSIFAELGMDYSEAAAMTARNGEPGFVWLDNMRNFGRMGDPPDGKDYRAMGCNPCFQKDSLIAVADGRGAVPIKELVEEGKDVPVYSVNPNGEVEIKWGRNPRLSGKNKKLIKIILDDDSSITTTLNHEFRLVDGTPVKAKDLKNKDSLARLTKRLEPITYASKNRKEYLRVNCDTTDARKNKIFEHRLIAKFFDAEKWDSLFNKNKADGWINGGLVVHHKDYDSLNNTPPNLSIMSFREHQQLHANNDCSKENNGMFGRKHSSSTKKIIGEKCKEKFQDPEYREKCSRSIKRAYSNNPSLGIGISERTKKRYKEWCKEFIETTDLETLFIDNLLHVIKYCEYCGEKMILPVRQREVSYCNTKCGNHSPKAIAKRTKGINDAHLHLQQAKLVKQISIYKNLCENLQRKPLKEEWIQECKNENISFRIRKNGGNEYVLRSWKDLQERAVDFNHRVKETILLEEREDVYTLTVDDNHTVGIVTSFNEETKACSGVFTFQCGEQTLENLEMCNLVENFPINCTSLEDFKRTLKFAYLYAKTVTLIPTHHPKTNAVMMRNRRIGCSMGGITQTIEKIGRYNFLQWCNQGYQYITDLDRIYSDWLCVPQSKKKTSIKPGGTTPLLPGCTSGGHLPISEFYIKNMRIANTSPLIESCKKAGYRVEPDVAVPDTAVVALPIKEKNFTKSRKDATIWEQFETAAFLQEHWADNQVSVTITFKPEEVKDIVPCLEVFQTKLKAVSLMPLEDHGFDQAPLVPITEEEYNEMLKDITPLDLSHAIHEVDDRFCTTDTCQLGIESEEDRK